MLHLLLTDPKGFKKLVNMALISEAFPASTNRIYTNLVVSGAPQTNSLIVVSETPAEIYELLRVRCAEHSLTDS